MQPLTDQGVWELLARRVVDLENAVAEARRWRQAGEIVALTNGCFDILHAGHLFSFLWARQLADRLIVGINDDASVRGLKGPKRPINPERERAMLVAALRMVDLVVLFPERTADRLIEAVRPHFYVKGGDYVLATLPEAATVRRVGARLVFVPLLPGRSTTGTLARIMATGLTDRE
ncbi:MAG: adenylyltransferase/cytidyltransferase family protein [Limnochordales bacterium]|nr:adenylyltransferase/cytidyltransferase family protein [Limnochordales bacterium]